MYSYTILGSTAVAATTGGLFWLNSSDSVFRVKHALIDFGFTILSRDSLSKDCQVWLGYSFYSVNQKEFLDARQKCVKPVKFSELARGQGLVPINPWSSDVKNDNQPDWLWAATIFDQSTTSIHNDIKQYVAIPSSSGSLESGSGDQEISQKQTEISSKLSKELEQFTNEQQKTEFTKNLASLLVILDYIDELRYVCWALQDTHHNSDYDKLTNDWNFYVRYCTKFSTD